MINLRLMVVDEEAGRRALIESSLARDRFFVVRDCASAGEATATAIEWRPDLILLDDTMTDTDGTTVLAAMQSDKRTAPIPVLLMTERVAECRRFKALGAVGVIGKPIEPNRLPAAIRRFVPVEGSLAVLREKFLERLEADASALSACRASLMAPHAEPAMRRVNQIAHALAGAGGIYGFAGITCESAALAAAAEQNLAGRAKRIDVEQALDRLLMRIMPAATFPSSASGHKRGLHYSAATA